VDCEAVYSTFNTTKVLGVAFFIISNERFAYAVYDAFSAGYVMKIILGVVSIVSVYTFKDQPAIWKRT
jgi:hypothetical protein